MTSRSPARPHSDDGAGPPLSAATRSVWAKSGRGHDDSWLPLHQHLADAAGIAGILFDRWIAPQVRTMLAEPFGQSEADARSCLLFLAGTHDLGKCSPAFAHKVPRLAEHMGDVGLPFPVRPMSSADRELYQHSNLSHVFLRDHLTERLGLDDDVASLLASVTAAHHGYYPSNDKVSRARLQPEWLGGQEWEDARAELIELAIWAADVEERLHTWTNLSWTMPVLTTIGALVVVADWLASADEFFPLWAFPESPVLHPVQQRERVDDAWRGSNFTGPWDPNDPGGELYGSRFGSARQEFTPRPTQSVALQLVREHKPKLLVVEAPMGSGKTELGLVCAEVMAGQNGAGGLIFALPTMATTNAVFGRLKPWLDRADVRDYEGHQSISLTHGAADLNEDFLQLLRSDEPLEVHDDDASPHSSGLTALVWMTKRWRKTLANVVVSTIDHVLMAALMTRHFPLRLLGLMGKVVVIDEVHSSDAYMAVYLEAVLGHLGRAGVPVVLLSATLAPARRRQLVEAYLHGVSPIRRERRRLRRHERQANQGESAWTVRQQALDRVADARGYPLLTFLPQGSEEPRAYEIEPEPAGSVLIDVALQDDESLVRLVTEALVDGGCVGVIRNTVANAQQTALHLRARLPGVPVVLAHSRFTREDRAERDTELLKLLGKGEGAERPERCVIVATQVIEQSLDIDLDYLITDPAPMDLVLQRIGRLHRHQERVRPERLRDARCTVLVADLESEPWAIDPGTNAIYGASTVLRMLGIVAQQGGQLTVPMPSGIAEFVRDSSSEAPSIPVTWQESVEDADGIANTKIEKSRRKASTYLLTVDSKKGSDLSFVEHFPAADRSGGADRDDPRQLGDIRGRAAVRDTEDKVAVLLIPISEDGRRAILPPREGEEEDALDTSVVPTDDLARRIRTWSIDLPHRQLLSGEESPDDAIDAIIDELESRPEFNGWAWQDHPLIRGELFLTARREGPLSELLIARLRGKELHYDPQTGLRVVS